MILKNLTIYLVFTSILLFISLLKCFKYKMIDNDLLFFYISNIILTSIFLYFKSDILISLIIVFFKVIFSYVLIYHLKNLIGYYQLFSIPYFLLWIYIFAKVLTNFF